MNWIVRDREAAQLLGFVPGFLDETDPRPAAEQIAEHYIGGWQPIPGCKLGTATYLIYPGDPPLPPLAYTVLPITGERVVMYVGAIFAVIQADGAFEVARLD